MIIMKISRNNIAEALLDKQLEIVGKTKIDILDNDCWKFDFTMTQQQLFEFKKYAIPLLQKVFHVNRLKAESIFDSFRKLFGVRIKG